MRFALATGSAWRDGSPDDHLLATALEALGAHARFEVWDDRSVDWSSYDAVVVRSTWDYHRKYDRFLEWVAEAEHRSRLFNPPALLRWNSHKSYLLDYERLGVAIVPTRFCDGLAEAERILALEGWATAVVKPAVSADGFRTYRVQPSQLQDRTTSWKDGAPDGALLVQPYLSAVERTGERSLVLLDGVYSHAFLRSPKLAAVPSLVEGTPLRPTGDELTLANQVVRCTPSVPFYARVDIVRDDDGSHRVMEVELVEPFLGLGIGDGAAHRLAQALVRGVG